MNLLLIDSSIPNIDYFIKTINLNTKFIIYSNKSTFDEILERIKNFNILKIDYMGFVFRDDYNPFKLFVSYNTFISVINKEIKENNTTLFIKNLINTYSIKNLDFLACNLLNYELWRKYFDFILSDNKNLILRASNDTTGNLKIGGNWIMENMNEDISKIYFNDNLKNWNYLLDSNTNCTAIIKNDNTVWLAGSNEFGQIGNGNLINQTRLVQTIDDISNNTFFDAVIVSCGSVHTAILKSDGSVWTCGSNSYGQLGIGGNNIVLDLQNNRDINIFEQAKDYNNNLINDAISVVCGAFHTIILKSDGSIWSCGLNFNGQLGDGTNINKYTFVQCININNEIMTNINYISSGSTHTAIIKNDGTVWTCGSNFKGQLGTGNNNDYNKFIQSYDLNNNAIINAKVVSCGSLFTCVIKNDNTLWCVGDNLKGQLGLGDNNNVNKFYQSIISDVYSVACGYEHTLVIKSDYSLWGSGNNNFGQLGNSSNNNYNQFTRAKNFNNEYLSNIKSIECGSFHSFCINNEGKIYTCGNNQYGQLGNDTYLDKNLFEEAIFDGIAKYTKKGIKDDIIDLNSFMTINTNNNYVYFPNLIDNKIYSTDISHTNSSIKNELNTNNKIIVKLGPKYTKLAGIISFSYQLPLNITNLIVYFDYDNKSFIKINNFKNIDINKAPAYYYTHDNNTGLLTIYTRFLMEIGIGYNTNNIDCLFSDTLILTPYGYKKINKLKIGDNVITNDMRIVPIKNIKKYNCKNNIKLNPFIIPKNYFGNNIPSIDTRLSGIHNIYLGNTWLTPKKNSHVFKKDNKLTTFQYYHIELENYLTDNLIINGGIIVESYGKITKQNLIEAKNRFKYSYVYPKNKYNR